MRFLERVAYILVVHLSVYALSSCSRVLNAPPSREVVEPLLQQEAQSLKREGEQVNPSLGVKITWTVQAVEVREQPDDEVYPWAGTIRFLIKSEQKEYDGSTATQEFEKVFDYVWDVATERWIVKVD